MTIRFEADRAIKAFAQHLAAVMQDIQQELLADAQSRMSTPEGARDLVAEAVQVVAGMVTADISGSAWSLMDEWGKGSLMDTENPDLPAYRAGPTWNPSRRDLAIRGRPKGAYTDIFGDRRVSTGRAKGVNLERLVLKKAPKDGTARTQFLPRAPSHAVQTAFRWMESGRFRWYLARAVDTFPWGAYLKVTNTTK